MKEKKKGESSRELRGGGGGSEEKRKKRQISPGLQRCETGEFKKASPGSTGRRDRNNREKGGGGNGVEK